MAVNLDDYSLAPPKTGGLEDYSLPYEASDYHLSGLDPDMRRRFEDMAGEYYAATGEPLKIESGYRSTDHQARLHAADPNSGMVAPPGNSTHEQGKAIDLHKGQIGKLEELGLIDKYFNRPLMGQTASGIREPWHIEHPEARADQIFTTRKKGVLEQVGDLLGPGSAEAATGSSPRKAVNLDDYSLGPPEAANLDDYSLTGPEEGAAGKGPQAGTPAPLAGDTTSDTLAQFAGVPQRPKSVMMSDAEYDELSKMYPVFKESAISARPEPGRKLPAPERTESIWKDTSMSLGERLLASTASAELPPAEAEAESLKGELHRPAKQPVISARPATKVELVEKNIAAVNRPVLEELVGYAGILEDVLAIPYRTISGDKSPIARPLTFLAKELQEKGAPEHLKPGEGEDWATMPGQVVGGLAAYMLPGKFVPKGGNSLFERYLHNLGAFLPADVARGYAAGGEEGAKRGLYNAVPMAAAFTVAQVLPGRGAQTLGVGTAFAGSAYAGGERDPYKLTADFLTGVGLHWLGSRGQARQERIEQFVGDWKKENGITEKEFDQVKETLGSPVPEKWQKEMETFAGEGPPPEEWGEWTTRAKKSGEPVIFQTQETAEKAAGYVNRPLSKKSQQAGTPEGRQEARAVETEDGWTLQVRERAAAPAKEVKPPEPRFEGEPGEFKETTRFEPAAPPDINRVPVEDIKVAPEDFQFKLGAETETGAGLALKDVKKFDEGLAGVVTLWRSPEGELYVVNGHQRLDLAKRTKTGEINARVLPAEEFSKPEARAYGALINMAEGRGTEVDLAKFLRDTGLDPAGLQDRGISLSEAKTRKALALKELSDGLFRETALGRLPVDRAAIIGKELAGNEAAQEAIYRTMQKLEAKGKEVSNEKLQELLRLGKNAPVLKQEQLGLFGVEELKKSLLLEQAELMAYAKRQLRRNKTLFGQVSREKGRLEQAGNVIDPETNQVVSREAAEALDILDKAAYIDGSEANTALNDFARQLAAGRNKSQVKANFYGALKKALKTDRAELLGAGREAGGRPGGSEPEAGGAVPAGPQGARPGEIRPEVQAPPVEAALPPRVKDFQDKFGSRQGQPDVGMSAPSGEAAAPDLIISPDGEIKMYSFPGVDTADVAAAAKGLEARMWETMAHHKIMPPGQFLKGRMAKAVPREFMRQGFKEWLSFGYMPKWVADKWEAFKPFYEADLKADDVMANHRYEIYGKLKTYFRELSGAERRRVHDVALGLDRIKSAERRRSIESEIESRGPVYFVDKHGLSPKEADAAHGLAEAYRYVRLETLEGMKQDVVDLGMKYGLDEARAREFAEDVLEKDLQGDYYPLHYSIMKFLPGKEGMLYDTIRRQRENYDFWSRERALYMFPHTRWGPYWLHVWAKGKEGLEAETPALLWAGAAESIGEYKKMAAKLKKEFAGEEVEFKESRREKVPMELYNDVHMPGLAAIMELSRDQFEAEAWTKFLEAKQAFFAQKGWGAHKIHRSDIPGFETENDKRVISDYFEGWIGMQGKTNRVRGFTEAWQGFKDRGGGDDAGLQKYSENYVNYLLEHPREAGKIRTLLYHLYLGGSMGFRLLHGLHALQTAWPEMSTISKQPGRVLSRAIADRAKLTAFEQGWSKDPGFTAEELSALEQGRRKAALSTDYTAELAARSGSPLYRLLSDEPQGVAAKLKRGFDLVYYPTAADRFTREAIFLGAVRELRGKGPITPEVVDGAAEIVNNSMYRYARGERPRAFRREGAIWATFQTWSSKYFQQIFGYMRDGEYKALGRLVAAAGMVGGLNALGMRDVIQAAYRNVYGRDAESDAKHYLQTVLGDRGGEALNRIMFRGLPAGVAGFDLSPRMVHHLPWNFLIHGFEKPLSLLGAVTGPIEGAGRSVQALSENAPGRAVEALAPTWLRNPMAAHRLYTRGPETVSGRPIVGPDFKQHKMSLGEAALKASGVQPTRLSEEQGKFETSKTLEKAAHGKLQDWASRAVQAKRANDKEELRTVLREWNDYNRRMQAAGRRADIITVKQFRAAVQIRERPVFPEKTARKTKLREMR